MRKTAQIIALLSLLLLIVPPMLFLAGRISLDSVKMAMLVATVTWFIAASFWLGHEDDIAADSAP